MDRKKIYEIFPFVGIADVRFGMSRTDVEVAWGTAARNSKNFIGDMVEIRDGCVVTYDARDGLVAEIGFPSSYTNLVIKGVDIFQQPPSNTITQLRRFDSDGYEGEGFIVFRNLGISLSGFRGSDINLLTATAFKTSWWDDDLVDMTKLA